VLDHPIEVCRTRSALLLVDQRGSLRRPICAVPECRYGTIWKLVDAGADYRTDDEAGVPVGDTSDLLLAEEQAMPRRSSEPCALKVLAADFHARSSGAGRSRENASGVPRAPPP
jgi:hypothetical protein